DPAGFEAMRTNAAGWAQTRIAATRRMARWPRAPTCEDWSRMIDEDQRPDEIPFVLLCPYCERRPVRHRCRAPAVGLQRVRSRHDRAVVDRLSHRSDRRGPQPDLDARQVLCRTELAPDCRTEITRHWLQPRGALTVCRRQGRRRGPDVASEAHEDCLV